MRAVFLIFVTLLSSFGAVTAQEGPPSEEAIYISRDGTFQFTYPLGWALEEADDGFIDLYNNQIALQIVSPLNIAGVFGPEAPLNDLATLNQYILDNMLKGLVLDEPFRVTLRNGNVGFLSELDAESLGLTDEGVGFAITIALDSGYAFILVGINNEDDLNEKQAVVETIVESFTLNAITARPTYLRSDDIILNDIRELDDNDQEGHLEALREAGVIPEDGEVIFFAEVLDENEGEFSILDETVHSYENIVISGVFTSALPVGDETYMCSIISQATYAEDLSNLSHIAMFSLINGQIVSILEIITPDVYNENFISPADFDEPQHLLISHSHESSAIYVNGASVVAGYPLIYAPEAGQESMIGTSLDASCTVSNLIIYGYATEE